jgi:hypothetical protein
MSKFDAQILNSVILELNRLHREKNMSWRQIALKPEFFGIDHNALRRIANGEIPTNNKVRAILGLSKRQVKIYYRDSRLKTIQDMTVNELLWALENRQEF